MMTLASLEQGLRSGSTSALDLALKCLAAARNGEGPRVYLERFEKSAPREAERSDAHRSAGERARPLEGIPVSIKDLFDVAGRITRAASPARPGASPALADAPAVARLRAAGAVIIGATNMTEFAYSGLGLNPHFGTPLNPFDRAARRVPGGSSSGAAVSVTDDMAALALGSDTGGSVRIPAAFCGLVGFKPTAARISRAGVLPLSTSFDSVGPLATDVAGCLRADAVLADDGGAGSRERRNPADVRLLIAQRLRSLDVDPTVAAALDRAFERLARAGVELEERVIPAIEDVPGAGLGPVIVGCEAYAWHRENLARHGSLYDPRVRARLELGAGFYGWQYVDALARRARFITEAETALGGFDGWLMPTVPIVAPRIETLADDEAYVAINRLVLRNSSIVNFLDGCAVSLPCHRPGEAPVGLTLAGLAYWDARILAVAQALEPIVRGA